MKILIKIFLLNIIIITLISCNDKENNIEKEHKIRREINADKLQSLKEKHTAKELFEYTADHYYSFELENKVVNKNVVGLGNIHDIEKINDDLYLLKLSIYKEPFDKYYCELKATKDLVNKIIKAKELQIIELEKMYKNSTVVSIYLKLLKFNFVFKPLQIKKGLYINSNLKDYVITGESIEEATLEEYNISLEPDYDHFTVFGNCIDVSLVKQ